MFLNAKIVGPDETPLVAFCHGLFGQGKNWGSVAKALATPESGPAYRSLLMDMPDHGNADWTENFDYPRIADFVADEIAERSRAPIALVGHSMGGKIAMQVALRHPDLVERLCVVDVSPVDSPTAVEGFGPYIRGMRGLDLAALNRRDEAHRALAPSVPDETVRSFLLQNLRHEQVPGAQGRVWRWQFNLALLGDSLPEVSDWPHTEGHYDGPVLWVGGQHSSYIRPEYVPAMKTLFPRVRQVTIKGAGHWVHSEQPEVFVATVRAFLNAR